MFFPTFFSCGGEKLPYQEFIIKVQMKHKLYMYTCYTVFAQQFLLIPHFRARFQNY